jgi:uncharacterized protein with FMN-binding domain
MKRIIIVIAAVAGVGGLIALMSYHPQSEATGSTSEAPRASEPGKALGARTPAGTPTPTAAAGPGSGYKDGTYTGSSVDVGYGMVQVAAVISGGKLTSVNFLQMPQEGHSAEVASQAKPILLQESISAQSANVDLVTGATQDWEGFVKSMQSALAQAKA